MFPNSGSGAFSSQSRPGSSASFRPSSSTSQRPTSSASHNIPPTSFRRPPSSVSASRPVSRVSQRPNSRHAQRQQSSRLLAFCQVLLTQLTGLSVESDEENYRAALDFTLKNLEPGARGAVGLDVASIDKHVRGHAQKARINMRDNWASALEASYERLKIQVRQDSDLDTEIKILGRENQGANAFRDILHNLVVREVQMSHLPDHLQLLLLLSTPPTKSTLDYANALLEDIKKPQKPHSVTWADILAEEPFEGQHWQGVYGLPPGSIVDSGDIPSEDSSPLLSPLDDPDDVDKSVSSFGSEEEDAELRKDEEGEGLLHNVGLRYDHREKVEELQARQYWRPDWRPSPGVSLDRPFNIGDASTLGPAMHRVLANPLNMKMNGLAHERYIYEHDAVREILMALQGRQNLLLIWTREGERPFSFAPSPASPRLIHLTLGTQSSILSSFAGTATTLQHLRKFISSVFVKAYQIPDDMTPQPSHLASFSRRNTRTLEAFTEALDAQVLSFDAWCAAREEDIVRASHGVGAPLIVSLLSLEKAVRDAFSEIYHVLLGVTRKVMQRASRSAQDDTAAEVWILSELPTRVHPSVVATFLLDSVFEAVHDYASMGDTVTSSALMRIFVRAAEPMWAMVGRWLKSGMPVHNPASGGRNGHYFGERVMDEEFFIEDNELVMVDPDFWIDGYTLRRGGSRVREQVGSAVKSVPIFLEHVARSLLSAGKGVGLVRALGVPGSVSGGVDGSGVVDWGLFSSLLGESLVGGTSGNQDTQDASKGVTSMSVDTLSSLVYDELLPLCQSAQSILTRVLFDECDLMRHLSAIQDLYLMRKGDDMTHFSNILFGKMDSKQQWSDFHFLNTSFTDVVEAGGKKWIDTSLVRLSYRGSKDRTITRTVKAIDGLLVEYAVPFPLTYIFSPRAVRDYNSVFVFLLQLRRAKTVLDSILVRDVGATAPPNIGGELKVFYAMRSKLSWFVNTLLNFVATHVLHTQVMFLHDALRDSKSLDDIIELHDNHLEKIQSRCLLQDHTSALHRAVTSVLDMSIYFSDCFTAFAGDTTHDISRASLIVTRRHRSRNQRRQRRNVVGFSQPSELEDDSDTDSEEDEVGSIPEPSFSMAASSISLADEGFFVRLDKISSELDGLVRFIRRGVESLAAGVGESAQVFGVLAFSLEDWDR